MEDYLKTIYLITRDEDKVTTQSLAERLEVSPASVTNMLKRLSELHLVDYTKYKPVELTDAGRKVAMEMIRHHRLLELYLTEALGFSWDEVHAEAELLEHFISEKLEAKIDEALGFPSHDPHGSPIPTLDGEISTRPSGLLADQQPGLVMEVVQVVDTVAEVLRRLEEVGVVPGVTVRVLGMPEGGSVHLRIGVTEQLLDPELCAFVRVGPVESDWGARLCAEALAVGGRARVVKARPQLESMGFRVGASLERHQEAFVVEGEAIPLSPVQARWLVVEIR
ncbi:MAG: metal-dependent transcriptional regulator [Candidatus Eremiobacteraeota bacterium]|nr:metal-dependent transcriptional regulator [Candidatus Eremiobacteraeota bacterium]